MIKEITFQNHGESLGTTLPKSMTDRLKLGAGDRAWAVETEHGILITPYDSDLFRVMETEGRISRKYENALKKLAE